MTSTWKTEQGQNNADKTWMIKFQSCLRHKLSFTAIGMALALS